MHDDLAMTREKPAAIEEAADELYASSLETFVERRRALANALRQAGDVEGARKLGALPKPPLSAWAVNQLWWSDRSSLESLFAAAKSLRSAPHARQVFESRMRSLRDRARDLLARAGHPATTVVLRRITRTLHALAAIGSFAPDADGRLIADREPPGFESMAADDGPPATHKGQVTDLPADAKRVRPRSSDEGAAAHTRRSPTDDARRTIASLKRELRALEREASRQADTITREQRALDAVAVDRAKLEDQSGKLEALRSRLDDQQAEIDAQRASLAVEQRKVEMQRTKLETQRRQVETTLRRVKEESGRTRARVAEVEKALRELA